MIVTQYINLFFLVLLAVVVTLSLLRTTRKNLKYIIIPLGLALCAIGLGVSWSFRGDHMEVLFLNGTGGFEKVYLVGLSMIFGGIVFFVIKLFKTIFK